MTVRRGRAVAAPARQPGRRGSHGVRVGLVVLLVTLVSLAWSAQQAVPAHADPGVHDGWCKKGEGLAVVVDLGAMDPPTWAPGGYLVRCIVGGELMRGPEDSMVRALKTVGLTVANDGPGKPPVGMVNGVKPPGSWKLTTNRLDADGNAEGWGEQWSCYAGVDRACLVHARKSFDDESSITVHFQFAAADSPGPTSSSSPSGPSTSAPSGGPAPNRTGRPEGTLPTNRPGTNRSDSSGSRTERPSTNRPTSRASAPGSRGTDRPPPGRTPTGPPTQPTTRPATPSASVPPTTPPPPLAPADPGTTQQSGGDVDTQVWAAEQPGELRPGTPTAGWVPGVILGVLALSGGGIWWGLLHRRRSLDQEVSLDD